MGVSDLGACLMMNSSHALRGKEHRSMDRIRAWEILNEYTQNPALIRHALCVETAMKHYARLTGANEQMWALAGLLHDFDYERWPTVPDHTREGAKILRAEGCDEEIVGAILSHTPYNLADYPRDRPIRKALFAVDELCGLIYAAALIRPERLEGMNAKSIVKKMKQKAFAASVSREDIHEGAKLIGIDLSEHIQNCINAITAIREEVELTTPAT
jgi:putative nucleotidyltransferase with HDIG domain